MISDNLAMSWLPLQNCIREEKIQVNIIRSNIIHSKSVKYALKKHRYWEHMGWGGEGEGILANFKQYQNCFIIIKLFVIIDYYGKLITQVWSSLCWGALHYSFKAKPDKKASIRHKIRQNI